jgi:hypothetical protein
MGPSVAWTTGGTGNTRLGAAFLLVANPDAKGALASTARPAANFSKTTLDMHPEIARDHNDNDDDADDVENVHSLAPI